MPFRRTSAKRSSIVAAALAVALAAVQAVPAPALAHWNGTGQLIAYIGIYPYSYNSTWMTPLNRALSNWNATASPASFYKDTLSGSTLTVTNYSDTWYGYYQACGSSCMYVRVNSRTINRDASNFSNFVTSVVVHELGHALNLAHNSLSASIMNHSRNRNSMTTPQAHDIADVNAYY
ncbi:matrixin [Micromonospora violae]|uniref:Matrixin n=1 Tax=Micromonospora violae TaxID=1278207 RepID=A0A4Q7UD23_9ACTN|nr:matrixin family metalloprotease [Micromonospora violae]RZT77941.1 matrixin [Micromonospora violae]